MPTVLVVEDDAAIRTMMSRRLFLRGFQVVEAENGHDALRLVRASLPDAMLLDIGLPGGLSGWDVARALRADPLTAGLRIFAVTAHATPADAERARTCGCDAFFTKPVNFEALVEALRAPLAERGVPA